MMHDGERPNPGRTPDEDGTAHEEEREPGTVADTGEPAGTADAQAAGIMDTAADEDAR